mgnify:FL=1
MDIENGETINLLKVDSTNIEAHRLLKQKKILSPLWIVAEEQTGGKGRGGKKWISNKGNLFATLILPISFDIKKLPMISCVTSLATFKCLSHFIEENKSLKIKWPNDILFKNSKLSGILIENLISSDVNYSIIGIGINVNSSPSIPNHDTASLKEILGHEIDTKLVLSQLSIFLDSYIKNLKNNDLKLLIDEYRLKMWRINENVTFLIGEEKYEGKLSSINENFEIEIEVNANKMTFNSGELSFKY